MPFSKYAVPQWVRDAMPDKVPEMEEAAERAALVAVTGPLEKLVQAFDHDADEVPEWTTSRPRLVEGLRAVQALCGVILEEIGDGPSPVPQLTAAAATVRPAPVQDPDKKRRSSAVWYYIRNNLDDRYVDPGDLKRRDPETYRSLWTKGAQLYDAGQITPSGKPLGAA